MDKESIIMLKGPDRVRKRPAVVFSQTVLRALLWS